MLVGPITGNAPNVIAFSIIENTGDRLQKVLFESNVIVDKSYKCTVTRGCVNAGIALYRSAAPVADIFDRKGQLCLGRSYNLFGGVVVVRCTVDQNHLHWQ